MALEDPISTQATEALALRYGEHAPAAILWNDTIAQLLAHRTQRGLRKFKSQETQALFPQHLLNLRQGELQLVYVEYQIAAA